MAYLFSYYRWHCTVSCCTWHVYDVRICKCLYNSPSFLLPSFLPFLPPSEASSISLLFSLSPSSLPPILPPPLSFPTSLFSPLSLLYLSLLLFISLPLSQPPSFSSFSHSLLPSVSLLFFLPPSIPSSLSPLFFSLFPPSLSPSK